MPTTSKPKSIEQLLAEADELIRKFNSGFNDDLEEEHRLQFEKQAQRIKELKSEVQVKTEKEGALKTGAYAEGMHEAILDIVKAMKDLTGHLT